MHDIAIRNIVDIPITLTTSRTRFVSFTGVDKEHFAILVDDYQKVPVLTRVHSECMTGDLFGSKRCDCGPQLHEAIAAMSQAGGGILIYLRQEGRGIGLYSKFDAYELQQKGVDTFTANRMLGFQDDAREFETAAAMLEALGAKHINLITNNPVKVDTLRGSGLVIENVIPSGVYITSENEQYLRSKSDLKNHTIKF